MAIPVIESWAVSTVGVSITLAVTKPTGVEVGDLLLIMITSPAGASTQYSDNLTGWNFEGNFGGSTISVHCALFWKYADGTEGATTTVTATGGAKSQLAYYLRVSGASRDAANVLEDYTETGDTTSPLTLTSITTLTDDALAIYFAGGDGGDMYPYSASGTGWSEIDDAQHGTGIEDASGTFGTKEMPTAGSTGSLTISSSADPDGMVGFMFGIAPATTPYIEATTATVIEANIDDTTSGTVNLPSGIVAGELLVIDINYRGSGVIAVPSGWTSIASYANGSDLRVRSIWKKATGSEGGTLTIFAESINRVTKSLYSASRISGADTDNPIHKTGSSSTSGTAVLPVSPVTTTLDDCTLRSTFGLRRGSLDYTITGGTNWREETDIANTGGGTGITGGVAVKDLASSGSSGSLEITFSGGSITVGFMYAIAPAPAAVVDTGNAIMFGANF